MRFTVSQSSLAKALSIVSRGSAAHSDHPRPRRHPHSQALRRHSGNAGFRSRHLDLDTKNSQPTSRRRSEAVISGRMLTSVVKNLF